MSDDDFYEWHRFHVTMFALAPDDAKTVSSWRAAVDEFPVGDLLLASAEVLKSGPKSFRNEHVPAFFRVLAKKRRPSQRKFVSACRCKNCLGSPPESVEDQKFSFVKAAKKYEVAGKKNKEVPF